jgi:acyl carrier protein
MPVVVAEVKTEDAAELEAIENAIHGAVSAEHGLTQSVVLIEADTIFKTSSSKVQRQSCRRAYLDGELETITSTRQEFENVEAASPPPAGSGMTPDAVQLWLVEFIARLAYLDPTRIDVNRPLVEFGLGSADLVELVVELSDRVGHTLDTNLFFDHPTIAQVVAALEHTELRTPPENTNEPMMRLPSFRWRVGSRATRTIPTRCGSCSAAGNTPKSPRVSASPIHPRI